MCHVRRLDWLSKMLAIFDHLSFWFFRSCRLDVVSSAIFEIYCSSFYQIFSLEFYGCIAHIKRDAILWSPWSGWASQYSGFFLFKMHNYVSALVFAQLFSQLTVIFVPFEANSRFSGHFHDRLIPGLPHTLPCRRPIPSPLFSIAHSKAVPEKQIRNITYNIALLSFWLCPLLQFCVSLSTCNCNGSLT